MSVTLPEELLSLIFSAFLFDPLWKAEQRYGLHSSGLFDWIKDTKASVRTLQNPCLVSKTFKRVAQPLLYHTFRRPDFFEDTRYDGSNKRTKLFLRTLLDSPSRSKLAAAVKEISLGVCAIYGDSEPDVDPPSPELLALYQKHLPHCLASESGLRNELERGLADAEVVLILVLCNNVKTLDFAPEDFTGSIVSSFVTKHWSPNAQVPPDQRVLSKLRQLRVQYCNDEGSVGFHEIRDLFSLPNLNHLYGTSVSLDSPEGQQDYDFQCNLTHVQLQWAVWDIDGFESFLKACPRLEALHVYCGDACVSDHCDMDFEKIGNMLKEYGTGLQNLIIDPRDWDDIAASTEPGPLLGDLRSLSKLKYLSVPLAQLVDYDAEGFDEHRASTKAFSQVFRRLTDLLPSSLVEVTILDYFGENVGYGAWQDGCRTYKEANAPGNFSMHVCQRGSPGYGNTGTGLRCTEGVS